MEPEIQEKKQRQKMTRGTKVLVIILCVIVSLAILLIGTVLVLQHAGRRSLTDSGEDMTVIETEDAAAEVLDAGRVRYKGQLYKYKDDIITVLLMGIDTQEKDGEAGSSDTSNQSDANVLAVLDPDKKTIKLISISRDSMCEIDVLDENGEYEGTANAQLALSYSFGDGGASSCELTKNAVSRLFYGLPISAYASIYMDGIAKLVDSVGGVTVTPNMTYYKFTEGESMTLNGKYALIYLRYRERTVDGNNQRMARQKQVMLSLAHTMMSKIKKNPTSVLAIYSDLRKNITTDLNTQEIVYLASLVSGMTLDNNIYNVAGESKAGSQNHAEYIVDETALYEMILNIFYEPVEE